MDGVASASSSGCELTAAAAASAAAAAESGSPSRPSVPTAIQLAESSVSMTNMSIMRPAMACVFIPLPPHCNVNIISLISEGYSSA